MNQPNYGSFSTHVEFEGESTFLTVHPEMYQAKNGIKPSGRYFIYCIHPVRGSFTFIIEQDEHGTWYSENIPTFIDEKLIVLLGYKISMTPFA